ncbi:MAG: glycosyltransferase family 4 protein [Patescibacteria group bacterium]
MRILLTVEFYRAYGGGGIAEQVKQIAEGLVKLSHEVYVATGYAENRPEIINGVKIIPFKIFGNSVEGISGEIDKYRKFLLSGDFDVIVNFAANVWTTDIALELGPKIKAKKILSTPGVSMLKLPESYKISFSFSGLRQLIKSFYKRIKVLLGSSSLNLQQSYLNYYEAFYVPALKNYDRIVYTSANYQDKIFGDQRGLTDKAIIISNGASKEEFLSGDNFKIREKFGIKTKYLAITVANHYLAKGHSFVIDAFKKMRRQDTTLLIIGQIPGGYGLRKIGHFFVGCYLDCVLADKFNKNILVIDGSSRELVLSAYKNADVFLFGSELECAPLVMYESFASKTLFITREVGNVRDHQDYLEIIKTPEEMAKKANFYLDHPEERKKITEKAFSEWQNDYTWSRVVEKYNSLLQSI